YEPACSMRTGAPPRRPFGTPGSLLNLLPRWNVLRRLGQGRRVIGQRVQVGNDVRPLAPFRQSDEGHLGARREGARTDEERIEVVDRPVAALALDGVGITKARLRSLRPVHDAIQIGADTVGAALREGVACPAL